MNLSKSTTPPIEGQSEPFEARQPAVRANRTKLTQAAELMRDIRLAQSLNQLIQVLTHTLSSLLEASACGYLTWVQSPRSGLHWESITGEKGHLLEKTTIVADRASDEILRSGECQILNLHSSPLPAGLEDFMQRAEMASLQLLPVYLEEAVRGVVVLGRHIGSSAWSRLETNAGSEVVQLAVSVYAMRNELAQTDQRAKELERVFLAGLDLTAHLNLEDVLNSILKNALSLIPDANDAHIFHFDGKVVSFGAAMFRDGSTGKEWAVPREDGLTNTVAHTGEMIVVENMRTHPLYNSAPASWRGAIVGMPLKMKGGVIGVMTLAVLEPYQFQESKLRQLRLLADQAGIAIQNARLHNLIREEANTDWLTGLPNRRSFELAIDQLIELSLKVGTHFAVMMLDLDHFKGINDTYGHKVGDSALRRIASRLKEGVRKTDFLARLGGDEFAILFPATNKDEAYTIGTNLQEFVSVCDLQLPDGKLGCMSVSFGLAIFPDNGHTAEDLMEAADGELYRDKDRE